MSPLASALLAPGVLDALLHDGSHSEAWAWSFVEQLAPPVVLTVTGAVSQYQTRKEPRRCSPTRQAIKFCEECGVRFHRREKEGPSNFARRRFCGQECANTSPAVRAARATPQRTVRGEDSPHGLRAVQRKATPGKCIFCDASLPPRISKPRTICGAPDCVRARDRAYKLDMRRIA